MACISKLSLVELLEISIPSNVAQFRGIRAYATTFFWKPQWLMDHGDDFRLHWFSFTTSTLDFQLQMLQLQFYTMPSLHFGAQYTLQVGYTELT